MRFYGTATLIAAHRGSRPCTKKPAHMPASSSSGAMSAQARFDTIACANRAGSTMCRNSRRHADRLNPATERRRTRGAVSCRDARCLISRRWCIGRSIAPCWQKPRRRSKLRDLRQCSARHGLSGHAIGQGAAEAGRHSRADHRGSNLPAVARNAQVGVNCSSGERKHQQRRNKERLGERKRAVPPEQAGDRHRAKKCGTRHGAEEIARAG